MTKQTLNNSEVRAAQVASNGHQAIKLVLDVHAETIVVVRILDQSTPPPAQKFTPTMFLEWVKKQIPLADAVHSCYEAGPFGYGLHRQLVELGTDNVVVQPVCLGERHTGVNDDKRDARELALRLDRYVAGDTHALATVRVPTPEEEQKRIQKSRQREQLRREVQREASQCRSLLLTQSHPTKNNWWRETQWERLQLKLPVWLVERLEAFRIVLRTLNRMLAVATTSLEATAPEVRPKGLRGLTHAMIEREFGDWHRLANRRQVGRYTGLCGGLSASGKTCHLLPNAELQTGALSN